MVVTLVSVVFWAWALGELAAVPGRPLTLLVKAVLDRRRPQSGVGQRTGRQRRPAPTTPLPEAAVISINLVARNRSYAAETKTCTCSAVGCGDLDRTGLSGIGRR